MNFPPSKARIIQDSLDCEKVERKTKGVKQSQDLGSNTNVGRLNDLSSSVYQSLENKFVSTAPTEE